MNGKIRERRRVLLRCFVSIKQRALLIGRKAANMKLFELNATGSNHGVCEQRSFERAVWHVDRFREMPIGLLHKRTDAVDE